jgi:hypothetical protein
MTEPRPLAEGEHFFLDGGKSTPPRPEVVAVPEEEVREIKPFSFLDGPKAASNQDTYKDFRPTREPAEEAEASPNPKGSSVLESVEYLELIPADEAPNPEPSVPVEKASTKPKAPEISTPSSSSLTNSGKSEPPA